MINKPVLPFAQDALEPVISRETVQLHYEKHHIGYYKNLASIININEANLEQIIHETKGKTDKKSKKIYNNACQVFNHSFYWNSVTQNQNKIEGIFSEEDFIQEGMNHFGSGWLWITFKENKIELLATLNADIPEKCFLLGVCDLWEHAYYLDYKNERLKYLQNFLKITNYSFIANNLEKAKCEQDKQHKHQQHQN